MRSGLRVEGFHLERTMDSSSMVSWASVTEGLEMGTLKFKMPGDLMSGEDLLPGSQIAPSSFALTW